MGLHEALINWKNFLREAVGLPSTYPVKITRDEAAKKFPLLAVKKRGDVGYDLAATGPVSIQPMTDVERKIYQAYIEAAWKYPEGSPEFNVRMERATAILPRAVVPTGVCIQMPENIWASIEARSSASQGMMITPDSIIDAGYRGQLFAVVFNLGYTQVDITPGDRVVQVIFHKRILADFREVDQLDASERGSSGFGSTGRGQGK